jgi:hypothetical protein
MAEDDGLRLTPLNLAAEDSTLAEKSAGLSAYDCFIRDNLRPNDILVVSIGVNDVALKPSTANTLAIGALLLSPTALIEAEWAPGLNHFKTVFRSNVESYVKELTTKTVPATILVCMTYFPDEKQDAGAPKALGKLGYNLFPQKFQAIIRKLYEIGTTEIEVPGANVVPVPLFEVLDGKDTNMYVHRVKLSVQGARAIARLLHGKVTQVFQL